MLVILGALIVAGVIALTGLRIAHALDARRSGGERVRTVEMLALFAPAIDEARRDPRALLTWQPLAATARKLFPAEFAAIDAASGATFPFTREQIEGAHAQWSADWLAWERSHDGEYKLKAAAAQEELGDRAATPYGRARLEAIEREKLERYQQRYSEYVHVSKALQGLRM